MLVHLHTVCFQQANESGSPVFSVIVLQCYSIHLNKTRGVIGLFVKTKTS